MANLALPSFPIMISMVVGPLATEMCVVLAISCHDPNSEGAVTSLCVTTLPGKKWPKLSMYTAQKGVHLHKYTICKLQILFYNFAHCKYTA